MTYVCYAAMKARCLYPSVIGYERYSKLGICPQWLTSFDTFLADMGFRPSIRHSLERLDNSVGYWPHNVVWATRQQQARSRSTTKLIEHQGHSLTLAEWGERMGVSVRTLRSRLRAGWEIARALATPPRLKTTTNST